jgi:hypothetical protein
MSPAAMKCQAISLRPVVESGVAARTMGLALGRKSGKVEVNEKRRSQTAATAEEALALRYRAPCCLIWE